uniref:Uncharacterized protein n=1 Tax=Ditylenchus dipsaci TaxID=166011 RepID=A0A915EWQ8_9BILA
MWKSLRAYYMATKKKKPSGSQAEQVKKWAHSDEMSFLDNFIKERPEQSSSLANKNGPHTFEVMIDDNETVQIDLRNDTPVREKKPKMSALEAKLVEIMDKPEISTLAQDVDSMLNQLEKEGNKGVIVEFKRAIRKCLDEAEDFFLAR